MAEPLITSNATMLLAPFGLFPAAVVFLWIRKRIADYRRARNAPRSQATRGLSHSERWRRSAALHLEKQRQKSIEALGKDWVLHPEYKRRAK